MDIMAILGAIIVFGIFVIPLLILSIDGILGKLKHCGDCEAESRRKITEAQKKTAELEATVSKLNIKIQNLNVENQNLRNIPSDKSTESEKNSNLERKFLDFQNKYNLLNASYKSLERKCTTQEQSIQQQQATLSKTIKEKNELIGAVNTLQRQKSTLEQQIKTITDAHNKQINKFEHKLSSQETTSPNVENDSSNHSNSYDEERAKFVKANQDLQATVSNLREENTRLKKTLEIQISNNKITNEERINNNYEDTYWEKRRIEITQAVARSALDKKTLNLLYDSIYKGKLNKALDDNLVIKQLDVKALIPSSTNKELLYHTTLTECDCVDRIKNHTPCKHSLLLAYSLGILQIYPDFIKDKYTYTFEDIVKLTKEKVTLEDKIKKAEKRKKVLNQSNREIEKLQYTLNQTITRLITEKCSGYPYLAGIISELETLHYKQTADYLESKQHPAKMEARKIKELRNETRKILIDKKILEYKMSYLETLYPNINDVFDDEFDGYDEFELETEDTTDRTRKFLTHEEYKQLSVAERNQLALNRYVENRKSKWQIGRDYEMYIGYTYEKQGYTVEYTGILENLEDMGRDLIVSNGIEIQLVQCKNWSHEKTIHEKHIFQLYGTMVTYMMEHPLLRVKGVFVTTTILSNKAKAIAKHLGITVYENKPIGVFPRIKCNINRQTGEKIYHLPFDQQYDNVVVEKTQGEFSAFTVEEAEKAGYRRAFKHRAKSN